MDDDNVKDKIKIYEILNEIDNLRRYSSELANNVRGEKLESYVESLLKNINSLEDKIEKIYKDNYENNKTLQ